MSDAVDDEAQVADAPAGAWAWPAEDGTSYAVPRRRGAAWWPVVGLVALVVVLALIAAAALLLRS